MHIENVWVKIETAGAIVFLAITVFSVYIEDAIYLVTKGKHFWIGSWHLKTSTFHFVVAYYLAYFIPFIFKLSIV